MLCRRHNAVPRGRWRARHGGNVTGAIYCGSGPPALESDPSGGGSLRKQKSVGVTVIDLPRVAARTSFKVELVAGRNPTAADWPSIADDRDLRMYVFQSREFLEFGSTRSARRAASSPLCRGQRCRRTAGSLSAARHRNQIQCPAAPFHGLRRRRLQRADRGGGPHAVAPGISRGWADVLSRSPASTSRLEEDRKRRRRRRKSADLSRLHAFGDSGHAIVLTRLRDQTDTRRADCAAAAQAAKLRQGAQPDRRAALHRQSCRAETARLTERLLELKRRKYERTSTPDFLAAPGVERFYREMMSRVGSARSAIFRR